MKLACFVWISEQTANFALQNIKRLVVITELECLLRGMHRGLIRITPIRFVLKSLKTAKYSSAFRIFLSSYTRNQY